jgi:hypothetical protein
MIASPIVFVLPSANNNSTLNPLESKLTITKGRLTRTVLFPLFLYLNLKLSLGVQLEPQCLDVPIAEILHFLFRSRHS